MNEELYQLLGVTKQATAAQIKAAFRRLAKAAHPDAGGDPDEFVKLTMAYNTLMDDELRHAYDMTGQVGKEHPMRIQTRVIESLARMFEEIVMQIDVPVEQFDILQAMRDHIAKLIWKCEDDSAKMGKILASFHKMHDLIRRKGEGRNLFLDAAERKILALSEAYKEVQTMLSDCRRIQEELLRYESAVDIIRFMQAGAYPAPGRGVWTFFNPNITPSN